MEKVKITVEQEQTLGEFKRHGNGLDAFIANDGWLEDTFPLLKNFTPEEFTRLLCGWFEVKQPFEVGDWVYNKYVDGYRKIVVDTVCHENEVSLDFVLRNKGRYEKLTESWKIELLESGREKPELQIGDVYVDVHGVACLIEGDDFLNSTVLYELESGLITKIFPAERGIELKG